MLGVLRRAESLSSHRLLDRLIRGRVWIGLIAFALIGIVTMQLGLLKLNSGIGRALESEASLQKANAALSIENSELAAGNRVETQAARLGMKLVPISGLKFLSAHAAADVPAAVAALRTPVQSSTHEDSQGGESNAQDSEASTAAATPPETSPTSATDGEQSTPATGNGEPEAANSDAGAAGGESSADAATPPAATPPATTSSGEAGGGTAAPPG